MLTLVGSGIVISATSLIGQLLAVDVARRPRDLEVLQAKLLELETEINYGLTPLKYAFANVGGQGSHPVEEALRMAGQLMDDRGFMGAEVALQEAGAYLYEHTALKQSDLAIVTCLARALGKSDLTEQKRHFALAHAKLEAAIKEASANASRLTKPIRYLGFLSGLALVLIII